MSESSALDGELWGSFEVTSEMDWAKYSRIPNAKTLLHQYYASKDVRTEFDRILSEASVENGFGARFFLSQLSLKLLIQVRKDEAAEVDEETLSLLI